MNNLVVNELSEKWQKSGINKGDVILLHSNIRRLLLDFKSRGIKLDIKKKGELVGYIAGAGDVVPEAIRQMGYKVEMLDASSISANSLKKYDAVLTSTSRGFDRKHEFLAKDVV